jgi:DNA polymerase III epsilon subunit-like protein
VIVGHDLANDLKVLPIVHKHFIDTVALFPHNFGLPFKNKLKNLALEHLNRPIQWHSHNSKEDAKAALDLAIMHIKDGRGRMVKIEKNIPESHYSIDELIFEAELDVCKI